MTRPLVRFPNEAQTIRLASQEARVLLSADDTGGTHSLFEITVPAGDGPPPHIHSLEDETFIVLEGCLDVTIDDRTRRVGPRACIYGPRGFAHTFKVVGPNPARLLVLTTPGGFERFAAAIARRFPEGSPLEPSAVSRIMQDHGMRIAS